MAFTILTLLVMVIAPYILFSSSVFLDGGHAIQKIECVNHACKYYRRGALEQLVHNNPSAVAD